MTSTVDSGSSDRHTAPMNIQATLKTVGDVILRVSIILGVATIFVIIGTAGSLWR